MLCPGKELRLTLHYSGFCQVQPMQFALAGGTHGIGVRVVDHLVTNRLKVTRLDIALPNKGSSTKAVQQRHAWQVISRFGCRLYRVACRRAHAAVHGGSRCAAITECHELSKIVAERSIDPTRFYILFKETIIVMPMLRTGSLISRGLRMNCATTAAVSTGSTSP